MSTTMPIMYERRTLRRHAHELYPHGEEGVVRPLEVEVPYLYARATGLDVWSTGWFEAEPEEKTARIDALIQAQRIALLADAMLQGMTGQEAWEWADSRVVDDGGIVYDRAVHYGVPVAAIKPYPCGPECGRHDHMASTGDVMGGGLVTQIPCPESECETCTEVIPMHTRDVVEALVFAGCAWGDCAEHDEGTDCPLEHRAVCRECSAAQPALSDELDAYIPWLTAEQQKHQGPELGSPEEDSRG